MLTEVPDVVAYTAFVAVEAEATVPEVKSLI
jgi:hypothetical protein